MKKILLLILLAILPVVFTSCENSHEDDDENWIQQEQEMPRDLYMYSPDGNFRFTGGLRVDQTGFGYYYLNHRDEIFPIQISSTDGWNTVTVSSIEGVEYWIMKKMKTDERYKVIKTHPDYTYFTEAYLYETSLKLTK